MKRIAECPRCGKVYKAEEPLEELSLRITRRLGTMNQSEFERFCPECHQSLREWRSKKE